MTDSSNPTDPASEDIVGLGAVEDPGAGEVSKRVNIGPYIGVRFERDAPTNHTIVLAAEANCTAGEGVTATFGAVNVIGTK